MSSRSTSRVFGLAAALMLGMAGPVLAQAPASAPALPPAVASAPDPADQQASDATARLFRLDRPVQQGSMVRGIAPAGAQSLKLDGAPVALAPDGAFLIGFDRDAPAQMVLILTRPDGSQIFHTLLVKPGNWRIEHVDASPTGSVSTEEYKLRRAGELEQISAARALLPISEGWRQSFIWPVKARISGRFGSQRIYRGNPGSYHGGLDLAGATGTPFVAPADGVVILAAAAPFTLEGNLLMIDHGMGLSSAFLHCSRLDVKTGDVVRQGQILGTIGATGRASGPHLHWGLRWGNARLDPLPLLGR